ncbi:hypothetical protein KBC03_06905 [Patescibacteria group bacterium]|nr:hypothetical protein [Patescibacteria group bacterium]
MKHYISEAKCDSYKDDNTAKNYKFNHFAATLVVMQFKAYKTRDDMQQHYMSDQQYGRDRKELPGSRNSTVTLFCPSVNPPSIEKGKNDNSK